MADFASTLECAGAASGARELLEHAEHTAAERQQISWLTEGADLGHLVVPNDHHTELVDLVQYLPTPRRAHGRVNVDTTDSFLRYVNRFASPATIVYVDQDAPSATAVLNDHQPADAVAEAGWSDWRVLLRWKPTLQWQHWHGGHGRWFDQESFAEHIEEGARAIVSPDGATLLEIAQTFKAQVTSQIAIARRQQSGEVRFEWNESVDARAGRDSDLTIPERILLRVAPFEGADAVDVQARLRFRLGQGGEKKLTLGYLIDERQQVVRDAVDREVSRLNAELDELTTIVRGERP